MPAPSAARGADPGSSGGLNTPTAYTAPVIEPSSDPTRPDEAVVVVLTFHPPDAMLETTIRSVLDGSGSAPVIVVDNGDAAARLLGAAEYDRGTLADRVTIIESGHNGGYGTGMNIGIDAALARGASAVALLNDDVVVSDGWLEPLLAELSTDVSIGAVQPLLVASPQPAGPNDGVTGAAAMESSDGEIPHVVNSAGVMIDRAGQGSDIARDRPVTSVGDASRDIDVFTGGAVVLRREFLDDVGRFDERFFLYYEDVDLARRGRARPTPWTYRLVPGSHVHHRGSASTVALGDDVRWLQERNRLWSSAMHGSLGELARGLVLSLRRLRHAPHSVHRRALVDGLRGMPVRMARRWADRVPDPARTVVARVRSGASRRTAARMRGTPGVNIVGYHHISSGLGSNARELSAALRAAGVPVIEIDNDLSTSPRRRPARPVPDVVHDTTIAIVTAFEFAHFRERFPHLGGPGTRMIGFWVWELDQVPPEHVAALDLVDEVWTPTTFVRDAYAQAADGRVPVRLAPFRMEEPSIEHDDVEPWRRGWGDDVVFLVSFDHLSIVERKNPLGAIEAFRRAFPVGDEPVRLVVKSINGEQRPAGVEMVSIACGDDPRIERLDEHLDDRRQHGLVAAADCFVSLHRSEGYGLQSAIAMWLGTAVIATRYSGVVDFLDDTCAAMVDAEMIHVTNGEGIYPETAMWADPDLDMAATHMRLLVDDPAARNLLVRRGRRRIADQPSTAVFGEAYAAMLRTPPDAQPGVEPFFTGLDAARADRDGRVRAGLERARRFVDRRLAHGAVAWPDTARTDARSATDRPG